MPSPSGWSSCNATHPCVSVCVILPSISLLHCRKSELSNHTHGALRVVVYDGVYSIMGKEQKQAHKKPVSYVYWCWLGVVGSLALVHAHLSVGCCNTALPAPMLQPPNAGLFVTEHLPRPICCPALQSQREAEWWTRLAAGGTNMGGFDAAEGALAAVATLTAADLVLTTFDVLNREARYMPSDQDIVKSLRHKKRYEIPVCPLLQVTAALVLWVSVQHAYRSFRWIYRMPMHCLTGMLNMGSRAREFDCRRAAAAILSTQPTVVIIFGASKPG
jgi:hypothetical protein